MEFNYDIMKKFIESSDWNSDKTCFMFKKMYLDYQNQITNYTKKINQINEINHNYKLRIQNIKNKELKFKSKINVLLDLEKLIDVELFCIKMLEYYREYYNEFNVPKNISEIFRNFLKENNNLNYEFKNKFLDLLNQYIF